MYYAIGAIAGIVIAILLVGLVSYTLRVQGKELNNKFVAMGELKGKTYNEIKNEVGVENSKTYNSTGCVRQWVKPGYSINLIFDKNDICLGVNNETSL